MRGRKALLVMLTIFAISAIIIPIIWWLGSLVAPTYFVSPLAWWWAWWVVDAVGYGISLATLFLAGGLLSRLIRDRVPIDLSTLRISMINTALAVIGGAVIILLIVAEVLGIKSLLVLSYIALGFAVVPAIVSWLFAPAVINAVYGARPDPELQELVNDVARRAGIKPPKAVLVPEQYPNAFAYYSPIYGSYVAVTEGLLRISNEDEVRAVIGHELGHLKHKDVTLMLLLGIVPTFIYFLGRMLLFSALLGGGEREERGGGGGGLLALIGILIMAASVLIELGVLAFSRLREYFADAHGAKVTSPFTMISALRRLDAFYRTFPRVRAVVDHSKLRTLFIYAFTSPFMDLSEVLATHPPIHKRILFLQSLTDLTAA